jgi:hypothetical protein
MCIYLFRHVVTWAQSSVCHLFCRNETVCQSIQYQLFMVANICSTFHDFDYFVLEHRKFVITLSFEY